MFPEEDLQRPNLLSRTDTLLGQVHIAVIRLDDKVDGIKESLDEMKRTFDARHQDHETRIRALEKQDYVAPATVWKVIGVLLTGITIAVGVIQLVVK